jgi:hypothetical protein
MAVMFAVANVAITIHRSLIPVALDGVIETIEVRHEKHPGVDDVWLVSVGGRRLHVDAPTARRLAEGQRLSKTAFQRRLSVDGAVVPLRLSPDAVAMSWVMPVVLIGVMLNLGPGRRLRRPEGVG